MEFREIGKRLSNWGRWGKDDRIGTLNHITDERRAAAGKLIKTGKLFELGLAVQAQGIQRGTGVRSNPLHLMSMTPLDLRGREDGAIITDDYIIMPLQSVTQWDGLAHFGYDGFFYNETPADTVTTMTGSSVLSIHQIAVKGIAGRGVLLDIARLKGVDSLESGYAITPADLEAAEKAQGVTVGSGDILLIRTGWIRHFLIDKAIDKYWAGEPGIDLSCAAWLHARDVAAICSDDWAVEVIEHGKPFHLPVHSVLIRDMGMTLGEIFVLEDLAADCAKDGIWEFFFASPPLKVVAGVGSPITPLAIK